MTKATTLTHPLRFRRSSVALFLLVCFVASLSALPSYTGYSGAAGSKGSCSSTCHGSGTGTISVTGFPQQYTPGTAYTITVLRSSGSSISNFNASTRKGSTAAVAGSFAAGTNSAVYTVSGYETGVRASVNSITTATFTWTAPAAGTGAVTFALSGLQGTKSGQVTKLSITSTELVTSVAQEPSLPVGFAMEQNFPNPFNPSTVIQYTVGTGVGPAADVSLKVYDLVGHEMATLAEGRMAPGVYRVTAGNPAWSAGIYFVTLRCGSYTQTRRMVLVK